MVIRTLFLVAALCVCAAATAAAQSSPPSENKPPELETQFYLATIDDELPADATVRTSIARDVFKT